MVRERLRKEVKAKAELNAEEKVLDALVGETASADTRQKFRVMLREGKMGGKEIEIQVADNPGMPTFDVPGMPGASMGMINLSDIFGKGFGQRTRSEEHTSELQSLMRISYAVFCLKKNKHEHTRQN